MSDTVALEPFTEPVGIVKVDRHGADWLRRSLLASNFGLMVAAGCWAIETHREWIRAIDAAIVVLGLVEFTRVLVFTKEGGPNGRRITSREG